MAVSDTDFNFYKDLLYQTSGLSLTPEKNYLIESRLTPIASSLGHDGLASFTSYLRTSKDTQATQAVIEAMTTNETSFFRDKKPFERLKEILPELEQSKQGDKTIRIWSAACSSGQEAYSISITMGEYLKTKPGLKYEILGTDISKDILKKAERGEYNQFEIQRGLTIQQMVEYFEQDGQNWRIKQHIRNNVKFQEGNLLRPLSYPGKFDIVMCRNVLIYFDSTTKAQALNNIASKINKGGYLFLGGCENIMGLDVPYEPVRERPGLYKVK